MSKTVKCPLDFYINNNRAFEPLGRFCLTVLIVVFNISVGRTSDFFTGRVDYNSYIDKVLLVRKTKKGEKNLNLPS